MDLRIPFSYVKDRALITWSDVHYAVERGLLDPKAAIDLALAKIQAGEEAVGDLLELAWATEPDMALVRRLALTDGVADRLSAKWLFLALSWLYDTRDTLQDPLGCVEQIYADFDYPEEVGEFVRYMPMKGKDLGYKGNIERIMARWRDFVAAQARLFSVERPRDANT